MPISSPGVNTQEKDLTFSVQNITTNASGFVLISRWGPVEELVEISTNEKELVSVFGQPDLTTTQSFHAAANALLYSVPLYVARAIGSSALNAVPTGQTAVLVKNKEQAENLPLGGISFVGRYPGQLGNSLKVSVADATGFDGWAYESSFDYAPTSGYFNLVVIDEDGLVSGTAGTILERYTLLSKKIGSKKTDGTSSYVKEVLKNQSNWINAGDLDALVFTNGIYEASLQGGVDDNTGTDVDYISAIDLFNSREVVDIARIFTSFFPTAAKIRTVDIVESRGDAVAFTAPELDDVYNNRNQVANLTEYFGTTLNRATSYNFQVDNWKQVYDKYNDLNIWIPCDSDASGLHARLFVESSPWMSPAGYNRGQLKNVIRLAWNSQETQRDTLYKASINSIISPKGEGTILFGDKTALRSPSAFSRINVRTLFIVLKKNISNFAKYQLFELNDYITRTLFKNACDSYLKTVKGGRGIYEYLVKCDETNNTPAIIDDNQFVGDIYVKPAKSINIINLNFVAVATGVDFTEVEGA